MAENVKIRCEMSVGYAIGTDYAEDIDTGYTRAEWDALDADDRRKIGEQTYEAFVWEQIDGGWSVVSPASAPEEG